MLKITGCFLILYASFMTGHAVGSFHTRMVSELEELILLIQIIKNQIIYEGTELPELLARCEKRTKGAVKMWLHSLNEDVSGGRDKPFGELWRDSMAVLSDLSARMWWRRLAVLVIYSEIWMSMHRYPGYR